VVTDARKVTEDLLSLLNRSTGDELIEIVVELAAQDLPAAATGLSRDELVSIVRNSFDQAAESVETLIRTAGGEIRDRAWINQTLRALIPVRDVERLSELDEVEHLDLTTPLEAEA
jgi:hypothetical protein